MQSTYTYTLTSDEIANNFTIGGGSCLITGVPVVMIDILMIDGLVFKFTHQHNYLPYLVLERNTMGQANPKPRPGSRNTSAVAQLQTNKTLSCIQGN